MRHSNGSKQPVIRSKILSPPRGTQKEFTSSKLATTRVSKGKSSKKSISGIGKPSPSTMKNTPVLPKETSVSTGDEQEQPSKYIPILIFITLTFVPHTFAQAVFQAVIQRYEREMVRLIYFRPSDRPDREDINTELDTVIKWSQYFYAEQMQTHGDRKTFAFETDDTGYARVHHITGKFKDTYYHQDTYDKVVKDVSEQFDTSSNVYLYRCRCE